MVITSHILLLFLHRYSTVQKTLLKENTIFLFEDGLETQQMFGLIINDLRQIKPNYEAMVKSGTLKITDEGYAQGNFETYFYFRSLVFVFFFFLHDISMKVYNLHQKKHEHGSLSNQMNPVNCIQRFTISIMNSCRFIRKIFKSI